MAYEFKNLNEVPTQDAPTENTTVMVFENGNPRQIPAGEFGGKGLVVDLRGYTLNPGDHPPTISDINYDPIYEATMAGQNVVFQIHLDPVDLDPIDAFSVPIISYVMPGQGFIVIIFGQGEPFPIVFTNGSYHTTA